MKKHGIFKRLISLVLSLVLIASCLPAGILTASAATGASGIVSGESKADPSTLDSWKDTAFNPYDLTTEHAGGVWTDKTVLQKGDIATAFPNVSGLDVAENNFLIALSALGANSVIAGQGTTPTDTIFVLDVSNSMENGDLTSMVDAANDAIHTLLEANADNRIGVVVYATNVNVLLPLDRYTPVTKTSWSSDPEIAYIEMSGNYGSIQAARHRPWGSQSTTYVKNSNGDDVRTSISASGATYIQGGLWQAYQMFNNATVSDTRTPVLVLMSDGAPSYGTTNYNNVNINSRNVGNGGSGSITDGLAFLTQLTAAYVKEKIADKYNTTAYLYSVGLGVSESGQQVSVAEAVLDTSKTRTNIENNWTTYLGLASAQSKTMSFSAANQTVSVTYDDVVDATSKSYTDRYFPASDASQLGSAFQGIVNEINLKASYNVTRIDGNDANTGGYVTFVDEIGTGMEVKDIKGILIGDHLFSGEALAKAMADDAFGTEENPTSLGNNMVWALTERLRISDSASETAEEIVWDLIADAKATGQISYTNSNSWSNVIGWFGDPSGNFVGFWDASDKTAVIPANAAYANLCYGMLGTTTDSQTAHASDMMYVAITVSKAITNGKIEDRTPQAVTFRIPAALLPTITYQIEVQAASGEEITETTPATITYNPAEPIRLLYEVGVHSQLNALNIKEFLREGYEAIDANGNYYLYTNAWYWEPDSGAADFDNPPTKENAIGKEVLYDTAKNHISYAYFEPSVHNEHYYYTEDTPLYVLNGTTYEKLTTAPVTDGSVQYYFQHRSFEATATATGTAVNAQVNLHYGPVATKLLQTAGNVAVGTDGVYYIKQGTMHYETIHDHDKDKTENATGSFKYRLHQLVDIAVTGQDASHHYEIAYLGNNGRITYAPAQGLMITKEMDDGSVPNDTFDFEVTLTAPAGQTLAASYETVHVSVIGAETTGSVNVSGGKANVSLKPGESIYILGLPGGTAYEVAEAKAEGYRLVSSQQSSGTIANNAISEASFVNAVRPYGALTVSKWVTYLDGVNPTTDTNKFDVTVTLTEDGANFTGTVTVDGQPQAVTNGQITFQIMHDQQVVIEGIPEGVAYTIAETAMPTGYTWNEASSSGLSGTMDADGRMAELANTYDPQEVVINAQEPYLTVDFNKVYVHNAATTEDATFQFQLQKFNGTQWVQVGETKSITFQPTANGTYRQEDVVILTPTQPVPLSLTAVGEHYFRIAEVIPAETNRVPGMTYDHTHHDFKVTVTDATLDGKLEISNVEKIDETVTVDGDATVGWTAGATFNNRYETHSTNLTLEATKRLSGATLTDGQFEFALYETVNTFDITGKTPTIVKNGANGDVVFPTATYPYVYGGPDYFYVMQEFSTNGNGVTVDPTVWEIEVDVAYSDAGEASVNKVSWRKKGETLWTNQVSSPANNIFNAITFENSYEAAEVKVSIPANKTLTNLTPGVTNTQMTVPANTYRFQLEAIDNAPMPANSTATAAQGGAVLFDEIEFAEAGVYQYKVTEQDFSVPGVSKDTTQYTAVITVTDNGQGQLEAALSYRIGNVHVPEITFNNTYTAAPAGNIVLGGSKELTVQSGDRDLHAGEFSFTLTHPNGYTETVSNTENGGQGFRFSPVSFDAVGSYRFTITEVIPHAAVNNVLHGITYNANVHTVIIKVTDNGQGQLVAAVDGKTLDNVVTFENFYNADADTIHLTAHKDLVGRDGKALADQEFSFAIAALTTGAPMPASAIAKNNENGDIDFGAIEYTQVGTYQYKVTELDANGDPLVPGYEHNGVTYSQKAYTVTVTVRDNGLGKLVAHVESVDENDVAQPGGVVFTNNYAAAPVKAEILASKELYNRTGGANENIPVSANTFWFVLEALNGAPAPQNTEVSAADGGAISFGEIEFTEAGIYRYTLTEKNLGWGGFAYDDSIYTVEVEIEDNLQGNLTVKEIRYIKGGIGYNNAVFTNSYAAAATAAEITAQKTLTNLTPGVAQTQMTVPADTYKFKLETATNAPLPTQTEVYAQAGGSVKFPAIGYTQPGTYTYTLQEIDMQVPGVANDDTIYNVAVTVKDDGAGSLYVDSVDYSVGSTLTQPVFANTYLASPVSIHVEGDAAATDGKVFTDESSLAENKKDLDDYAFQFILAELGGNVIQTVEDNGKGFTFDAQTYDTVGQHQYLIYERPGGVASISYDYAKYLVTVTVTDEGTGQLVASVKYEKAESPESGEYETVSGVLFQNSYKAEETSITLEGTKTLTGRTLQKDEFTFVLKDAKTGAALASVKNDEDGNFSFAPISYNAEGTYTYLLTEKNDGQTGITYDTAQYTVTVTVADVAGQLEATAVITCDGAAAEEIVFANVFTPEKEPEKTPEKEPGKTPEKEPEKTPEKEPEKAPEKEPEVETPQTGDNFQLGAWSLMMTVSAIGLLAVLLLGRKKETQQ